MYTAAITKIVGNAQDTQEYPVRNHSEWQELIRRAIPQPLICVSVCPYDLIVTSGRRGVYYLATLHRNDGTVPHRR